MKDPITQIIKETRTGLHYSCQCQQCREDDWSNKVGLSADLQMTCLEYAKMSLLN